MNHYEENARPAGREHMRDYVPRLIATTIGIPTHARILALCSLWVFIVGAATLTAQPFTNGQNAEGVLGQFGDYATTTRNKQGVSPRSMNGPIAANVDAAGRLYVVEWSNHRVLRFDDPSASDSATFVFGQLGSFASADSNRGGLSASTLAFPTDAIVDRSGRLYIADGGNNRVLRFDTPLTSATADAVYGQPDFVSNAANQGEEVSSAVLFYPIRLAIDSAGQLYVADYGNHRVLRYDDPLNSTDASAVYGQPDFGSAVPNNGGRSGATLYYPYGVACDRTGKLFVVDAQNNRVLIFDDPINSSIATGVIGQPNLMSGDVNAGGVSASSLHAPGNVGLDGKGRLYVCDDGNHRVLVYRKPVSGAAADVVVGHGTFTAAAPGGGQNGFHDPQGLGLDLLHNRLFVADRENNRVLWFSATDALSSVPTIQATVSRCVVSVDGNAVVLRDVPANGTVAIFDILGSRRYSHVFEEGAADVRVPLVETGGYVVVVNAVGVWVVVE